MSKHKNTRLGEVLDHILRDENQNGCHTVKREVFEGILKKLGFSPERETKNEGFLGQVYHTTVWRRENETIQISKSLPNVDITKRTRQLLNEILAETPGLYIKFMGGAESHAARVIQPDFNGMSV